MVVFSRATRERRTPLRHFITKHQAAITGTISCFDRILFKGYLPFNWPGAMERFLAGHHVLIKDFGRFVLNHSEQVKQHARQVAQEAGRPYIHLYRPVRKEEVAKSIRERDGITEGLVCVLAAVETGQTFKVVCGSTRPHLVSDRRPGLCLYFYYVDRALGFMHVRIMSWFPFTIQVCLNGHEWLARRMDAAHIAYRQADNAFSSIGDPDRAQRLADRFVRCNWPRILSAFARRVNPLLAGLLRDMGYYWVTQQAEFATDVMFRSPAALNGLYDKLLKHAATRFSAEDVMTFLGRKLSGHFAGEIGSEYKTRWPGVRVRHRMKQNGIKMYNKHGSVLRVETTINQPAEFKVRRRCRRRGRQVTDWCPMRKGVADLYRYAQVSRAANHRYLNALAVVHDPAPAHRQLDALARPARAGGRSCRGFNPALLEDVRVFAAVLRGDHLVRGFSNRDLRRQLPSAPPGADTAQSRRQAARVSRLLKRLHVHGLIAKVQRSRRWRVTQKGHALMTTVLVVHDERYPELLAQQVA